MYRVGPSRVERLSRSKVIAIVVFVFHWKWNWNLINVALWVCHCYCCCWRWVRTAATQQDCSTSNHNLPLMSICDDGKQKPILPTNWKCSTDFCTPKRFPPYVSCTNLDDFYWNRIHTLSEMIFFCVCLVLNGKIHCRKFSYSPSIEYAWHFSARIIYDFRLNRTEPIKSSEKQSYTGTKAMCNFNCISLFPLYSNWFVFDFLRVSDIVFRNNGLDSKRNISFWIGASLHLFVQSFSLSLDKCFALGFFPALFWRWLPE